MTRRFRLVSATEAVIVVCLAASCVDQSSIGSSTKPLLAADFELGTNVHIMPKADGAVDVALPSVHLNYYGGRVISNVNVVVVFWSPNVNATVRSQIGSFYSAVNNSEYFDWLSEYNTFITGVDGQPGSNQAIGRGTFAQSVTINPGGTTIPDSTIQTQINNNINSGVLPAPDGNTLYMVYFPPGTTITMGSSRSCRDFCAYHGTFRRGSLTVPYGVIPDLGGACATGCGTSTQFNNTTSVSSHEMIESVTDTDVGLAITIGRPLAWYDPSNGEIGDVCNQQMGTIAGFTVQKEWSNVSGACIISRSVANDFSISLSPTTQTTTPGNSVTYTVNTAVTSGSPQSITLGAGGLPPEITASFNPTTITAGNSSTLTLTVSGSASAGTRNFTVTGTGTSATHSASGSITVTVTADDFSIAVSPSSQSAAPGTAASYTVNTAVTSGNPQNVDLSISGLPPEISASFSPSSITSGASSTLTLTVSSSASPGARSFTVNGAGASASHSASGSIVVTGSGGGLVNGDFETGDLTGWASSGVTAISTVAHTGNFSGRVGDTAPSSDSSIVQTFDLPGDASVLSFWYQIHCPDSVTYDWATATLTDNTTSSTITLLPPTCSNNGTWVQAVANVAAMAGHNVTLTLANHDDGYPADPTYTLYDDVTVTSGPSNPIVNGDFETGDFTGWSRSGVTSISSTAHSGNFAAQLGSSSPSLESSISQTFTVPASGGVLSFWYLVHCPDTVTYDWATATLRDNVTSSTITLLSRTCTDTGTWVQVTRNIGSMAGHSATLTLINHDDNYPGDATSTLYDDVQIQ
jgi:hypothetical protein